MSAHDFSDVALSSTYLIADNTSYSVFYGCSTEQMRDIEMTRAQTTRERRRGSRRNFTINSDMLENKHWDLNTHRIRESLATCVHSRTLMDQIRSFKRQLNKVLEENESLAREEWAPAAIRDVLDEYEDKIDECSMMAANLSLTMQTGWSQISREDSIVNTQIAKANTTIALESQIENAQMRSIAVLGMIYLPLSCVGSIFSTTIFNWRPSEGEPVISNYIWILIVISAGLTALTILAWHLTTNRVKIKQEKRSKSFEIELDRMP
ncbi:hypothetical protein B0T26DRAFT_741601 [Lasiosphaeria miniovina]|uniref:Uncharacterized protein n=1 Tax=Lasiosphaeria miniovina TaxID=1954250 RepID=A0AA40AAU2_9PEZI|nr:uncharacterized protein B0T26DRAFT_741601 [Lasiosphaeria miniovina]KAK0712482.1 hypothetical protein B0T26DRAFT_741601 [Lasiosphaeria miniovina]